MHLPLQHETKENCQLIDKKNLQGCKMQKKIFDSRRDMTQSKTPPTPTVGMAMFMVHDINNLTVTVIDPDDKSKKPSRTLNIKVNLQHDPLEADGNMLENLAHSLIDMNYESDETDEMLSNNQMKKRIVPKLRDIAFKHFEDGFKHRYSSEEE